MVAYVHDENLRHVRTIRNVARRFRRDPTVRYRRRCSRSSAYSAWAEMTCFLTLGWKFPVHVFDLHTGYLGDQQRSAALRARRGPQEGAQGIAGLRAAPTTSAAGRISTRATWRRTSAKAVGASTANPPCSITARKTSGSRRNCSAVRSPGTGTSRRSTSRGCCAGRNTAPRPSRGFRPVACRSTCSSGISCRSTRRAVVAALIRRYDPSYIDGCPEHIYTIDGEFSAVRFERWLAYVGIPAWPRLASGALQLDGDAFRMMYAVHPAIENLHALRDRLGVIVRARIPIGRDGRNRPSLFPFGTATGRNAQSKSLFNAHASMRSFMKFPGRYDRGLSRLANPRGRRRRGAQW